MTGFPKYVTGITGYLAGLLGVDLNITNKHHPITHPLRGIDIDREYELIKQRKCTLPARLRKMIVIRKEVGHDQ